MAGLDLIFLIQAIIRLCLEFVLETGLITQGLFTWNQGLCYLSPHCTNKELREGRGRTADLNWPKGSPTHGVMLCIGTWGKKEEGTMFGVIMVFVFPKNCLVQCTCLLWN